MGILSALRDIAWPHTNNNQIHFATIKKHLGECVDVTRMWGSAHHAESFYDQTKGYELLGKLESAQRLLHEVNGNWSRIHEEIIRVKEHEEIRGSLHHEISDYLRELEDKVKEIKNIFCENGRPKEIIVQNTLLRREIGRAYDLAEKIVEQHHKFISLLRRL